MNTRLLSSQEQAELLAMIAADVAANMPGWELEETEGSWRAILRNTDGQALMLCLTDNRIEVRDIYPLQWPYPSAVRRERVKITCAITKTGQQIAADITRRFLPDYMTNYALLQERYNVMQNFQEQKDALKARFVNEYGATQSHQRDSVHLPNYTVFRCSGEIDICSGGSVYMNLRSVPAELALQIMGLLRMEDRGDQ